MDSIDRQDDENVRKNNQQKFFFLRSLQLPVKEYVIIGSGALGIRNLKQIGDLDILVAWPLWIRLAAKWGSVIEESVEKIVIPGGIVEAFKESSFQGIWQDDSAPSGAHRIANAEIIEGLPFDSLEQVLYFKRKNGREKDLCDILLIEKWLRKSN